MHQAEFQLPCPAESRADDIGFRIGWDHAHHGLVPPAGLLLDGTPIGEGWRAARAVFGVRARPWPATRHTRRWLALRLDAWRAGVPFDLASVTPNHLAQIEVRHCPVRRVALHGAADGAGGAGSASTALTGADAPCIERLNPQAAYAAGNLVMLSRAAAQAWAALGCAELVRRARNAEVAEAAEAAAWRAGALDVTPEPAPDQASDKNADKALTAAAWWRLATLRSFATPLPAAVASRLPMATWPPNRARVLNSAQALQVLLTMRLAHADWCARIRGVADSLHPLGALTEFNLWVGALAPRLVEAQAFGRDFARALEDAWLAERVQRRWQLFVLALGEVACEHLVRPLAAQKVGARRTEHLHWEQALDGWSLAPAAGEPNGGEPISAAPRPARGAAASLASSALVPVPMTAAPAVKAARPAAPARPAGPRRTAPTPFAPRPRATAAPRSAAR